MSIIVYTKKTKEGAAMPVMDEFKKERETIKNADFKTKLQYFFYYYKVHTIAVIAAAALIGMLIHDIVTQKDDALFVGMLNCAVLSEDDTAAFVDNYVEYAAIDTEEYNIQLDTTLYFNQDTLTEITMSASQRLLVYTSAEELDVIIGGSDIFPAQAEQGMFHDLRDILSKEQLIKYEPYFYYVDQAVIDETYALAEELSIEESYPEMPAPTKPEEMEDPVPVGLFVTDCKRLTDTYYFNGDYSVIGVMVNAPHVENSVKFIDYIFE